MTSYVICLAVVLLICVHACLGQSPMMFSGQPPTAGGQGMSPGGFPRGGMLPNPLLLSMALGGLDLNKLMYTSMLMNSMGQGGGGGLGGSMLPAFGLYNAFN